MEKQYESDLTKREKWQQQWETIRKLKGKERLDYLWLYYKWVLAAVLFIVMAVYAVGVMITNSLDDTLLSIVVVDASAVSEEASAEMEEDILDIIGTGGKHDHVEVVLSATSAQTQDSVAKLRVSLSTAGEADLVVCGQEVYEEYGAQGAFADMKDVLGSEYDYYEEYMTDGQIDLTKCPGSFLDKYVEYSTAYLCVLTHSERMEEAAEVIQAVVSE